MKFITLALTEEDNFAFNTIESYTVELRHKNITSYWTLINKDKFKKTPFIELLLI